MKRVVGIGSLVAASLFSTAGLADDRIYAERVSVTEVTSIYDADTFRADISGWPRVVGERMSIRINGVDAPEIRGKCQQEKLAAREAKQFTVAMLRGARQIELRDVRRGKYFRLLADVYADGKSVAAALIAAGLARPYDGGTRGGWCGR